MIAKHKWGTPISEKALLNFLAIDGDYQTAREVPFTTQAFPAMITAQGRASLPYTV